MLFALCILTFAQSSLAAPLPADQRERLRFRLENLYNEADLLVRNAGADRRDLERERREMAEFKVYERIPLKVDFAKLSSELRESARKNGVALSGVDLLGLEKTPRIAPKRIFTDQGFYRLSRGQLVQEIKIRIRLSHADSETISMAKTWIRTWQAEVMRLFEPEGGFSHPRVSVRSHELVILAKAFRFRNIAFPVLMLRDPYRVLPRTVDAAVFAQEEPALWNLAKRARRLIPLSPPLLELRRKLLLESQRMDFFISKATIRGSQH